MLSHWAHLSPTSLPGTPSEIGTAVSLYQDTAASQAPGAGPGTVRSLRRNQFWTANPGGEPAFSRETGVACRHFCFARKAEALSLSRESRTPHTTGPAISLRFRRPSGRSRWLWPVVTGSPGGLVVQGWCRISGAGQPRLRRPKHPERRRPARGRASAILL